MIFNGFGAVAVDCGGHIVRKENEERVSVCAWKHHGSTLVGQFCWNVLRAKSTLFFWRGAQQLGDCNGAWTGMDPPAEDQWISALVGADDQLETGLGKEQDKRDIDKVCMVWVCVCVCVCVCVWAIGIK